MPEQPEVPLWFTGPEDPWLTRRMRDLVEIAAGEAAVIDAVSAAIAEFLDLARRELLDGDDGALTAAAEDQRPPDLNAWPEESAWKRIVDNVVMPVIGTLFGERFKSETAKAVIADYPWRQGYLAEVWSRLKLWPREAWDDIRPELQEALSEGDDHRHVRALIGRVLRIDAPARRIEADINQLTKTIENPDTSPGVRREAKARRAALYRAKDREDSRWWFYAARIARTETLGALNGGTFYGAQAWTQVTGNEKWKQWWSTTDDRVRRSHWAAHMQVRPLAEKFRIGGFELDHPGDPVGPAHEVINCRCSLLTMSRDEAERERERYEAFRRSRTDNNGNPLDEDGRPIVASAEHPEVDMTAPAAPAAAPAVTFAPDDDPALEPAEAPVEQAPVNELSWMGVLAPLGHVSSDYRRIDFPASGDLLTRPGVLPLLFQEKLMPGHGEAVQGLANITHAWIGDVAQAREMGLLPEDDTSLPDDTPLLMGQGFFDDADPEAVKIANKVGGQFLRWVSVDLDKVGEPSFRVYRDGEDVGELEIDEDLFLLELMGLAHDVEGLPAQLGIRTDEGGRAFGLERPWTCAAAYASERLGFTELFDAVRDPGFRARFGVTLSDGDEVVEAIDDWRLMSTTMVSQPAFPEAFIKLMPGVAPAGVEPLAASVSVQRPAELVAAAKSWAHEVAAYAADNLHEPPAAFFENPNLLRPTNPTVAANGRVYGHIHDWTTAHIGYQGRNVRAPRSASGYQFFNLKPVRCADGSTIRCGALVLGTPHAGTRGVSTNQVHDHYDHTGFRVARIRVGADKHGTWFSGALVPGVTPEQVLDIAELTCSGDWREGELRAALLVNVPGFPIAEGDGAQPQAIVAAGTIQRTEIGIADSPDVDEPVTTGPTARQIAEEVLALMDEREEQRRRDAAALAAQEQRTELVASLGMRARAGHVEMLAQHVYGRRAAELGRRVAANTERSGRRCADAAAGA